MPATTFKCQEQVSNLTYNFIPSRTITSLQLKNTESSSEIKKNYYVEKKLVQMLKAPCSNRSLPVA